MKREGETAGRNVGETTIADDVGGSEEAEKTYLAGADVSRQVPRSSDSEQLFSGARDFLRIMSLK